MSGPHAERLVLIDGYAQVYRCFYAIQGLTNPRGEPTNALYGIARLLLRLDDELPHGFGAVVFDVGRPARRMELLPQYKQNRAPMPQPLRDQLAAIRGWMAAAGWPVLEEDGREADDLIAAIVALREGHETAILSHDKDLAQLVAGDSVYLLQTRSGGLDRLGPADVEAKFGVPPACIRDFLALLGDSSDNVPGVPGVGEKTAAALLQRFGSIPGILAHLADIERPKIRESLAASGAVLERNVELVSLDTRPPAGWSGLGGLRRRPADWPRLLELARDNGFQSLVPLLEKRQQQQREPSLF